MVDARIQVAQFFGQFPQFRPEALAQPVVGVFENLRQASADGRAALGHLDAVFQQQTANRVHLGGAALDP